MTIDCVREKLLEIESKYSEAIEPFERSWTSEKRKEVLISKLLEFTNEQQFVGALKSMEEGFSWPISKVEQEKLDEMDNRLSQNPEADVEMEPVVEKRRGMVRRFWSSDEAQEEWKAYIAEIQEGCSTRLYFAVLVFV